MPNQAPPIRRSQVDIRRGNHLNWFYWNTAWSLFFSLVWFMTITCNPDAEVAFTR
jgi:hypothetical protein